MLPWWVGNITAACVFLLCCLPLTFFLLRHLKGKKSAEWRNMELLATIIGSVGLISIVIQSNVAAERRLSWFYELKISGFRNTIDVPIVDSLHIYCSPHPRIASSPPNNEEIETQRANVCNWIKTDLDPLFDKIRSGSLDTIKPTILDSFPKVDQDILVWPLNHDPNKYFGHFITEWNDDIEHLRMSKRESIDNTFYFMLLTLSPYMLSIALSLQIVKVCYKD